jgi:ATP-dependent Clp protease ATP-binding subunit ClpA
MGEIVELPPLQDSSRLEHLAGLETYLKSRVIGQDEAIRRVSQALESSELGLNDTGPRPKGSFLFMGPTGVGKTETSKAFNEYLFGKSKLSMFFMNEYQRAESVPELVAGIRRAKNQHPNGTVFLFDEIEKAHPAIIDIFLSFLDEGQVTEGSERISLGDSYVVLTSNVGSRKFGQMEQTIYSVMEQFAYEAARKHLRPEMFARLTETVVYRPLGQDVQIQILHQMSSRKLAYLSQVLAEKLGYDVDDVPELMIDEKSVKAHLLRHGFSTTGGARRLRQELDRQFNVAVLPWIFKQVPPKEWCFYADVKNNCLVLR